MPIQTIQARELRSRQAAGPVALIDVRSAVEFSSGHVPGARSLPPDLFDPAALAAEPRNGPLYVICEAGVRSRKACERLQAAGITDLIDVGDGTAGWRSAALPLAGTGRSVFGVERQVRSIIGIGVLTGVVLALTVNPWWACLSGFFGGGLLMAGLTNICPLALLIAAMPWNRAPAPAPAAGGCCGP